MKTIIILYDNNNNNNTRKKTKKKQIICHTYTYVSFSYSSKTVPIQKI